MIQRRLVGLVAVLALVAVACGSDDIAIAPGGGYAIKVAMRDIAFSPGSLTVKAGETLHLEFRNTGKVDHEAILGDEQVQQEHEREMTPGGSEKADGGAAAHDGSRIQALSLKPGKSGELTHTFTASEDGTVIGCHEPGHYAAGMKIKVTVEA